MKFKPTIGLEIHIELSTKSKMFCSCKNDSNETKPNINICPICLGHPGTLPVINKEAVKEVIKTAVALNCTINQRSFFERKNYFYPDLPKGYQISQYQAPLSKNGYLDVKVQNNETGNEKLTIQSSNTQTKRIKIGRIHLEEDTGQLYHPESTNSSLIDFNRAGIPLMELVTEPDIENAQEARGFIKELQLILKYLKVSEANMEKGEMRVEVNISLKPQEQKTLGTKVEIKNLNSIRAVEKTIEFETKRQSKILEKGEKIIQETRGWHDKKEITFSQRRKEEAHDYRYFPEPDLPPLNIADEFLKEIRSNIPELPSQKRKRFSEEYKLADKEIELYVSQKDLGEYFEKVVSELKNWLQEKRAKKDIAEEESNAIIKLASNYIATDLQSLLKDASCQEEKFSISPENFAEFLTLLHTGEISSKIAKMVLKEMFEKGADPSQIIESKGFQQINDFSELEKIVKETIDKNTKTIDDYRKGKQNALQFLVGQVMAQTKGKANPEMVNNILKEMLK